MTAALQQSWFGDDWRYNPTSDPALLSFLLDGTTDKLEWLFQAREAITINRLYVALNTITGTTPTWRISLQGTTASTSYIPDGTIKGGTNNALKTFSPSGLGWSNGTGHWVTLDETYTCTRGEVLSIVLEHSSGTNDASNNATFNYSFGAQSNGFPRAITNAAGTRTHATTSMPIFGYGSTGVAYGRPAQAFGNLTLTNASAPREAGIKWTAPAGWGLTYTIAGVDYYIDFASSSSDITHRRYDGGGATDVTVGQSVALSHGLLSAAGNNRVTQALFQDATLPALNYGDPYRLTIENASATSMLLGYIEVADAADWDAFPGGQNIQLTQRDSGGNWVDTPTRRPFLFRPLIGDITEPTAGGILTPAGMSGGIHG